MFTPLLPRKKLISLVLVFLFLFGMIGLTAQGRQRIPILEDILLIVMAPVQGAFQRLSSGFENLANSMQTKQQLIEENARLKEQLAAVSTLDAKFSELQQENYRLREMLGFKAQSEYMLMPAKTIARDPEKWFDTIVINRGSAHGVKVNMAVVTNEGLVGNVISVSRYSSRVVLLTDDRRQVSAVVQRSREPGEVGVVESAFEHPGYLKMINLPREANIQPGDTIISSGMGGIFPKGFVIGHVLEANEDQYGILQYALLRPAVNFNRLEEVFVVMSDETATVEEEDHE